jgi:hypothetical protein
MSRKRPRTYPLRLSDEEWEALQQYADKKQISPAEVLRDYIKSLRQTGK